MSENAASGLCYIPFVGFIVAIIFLLIEPYNRNRTVRFHAFQSIFLHIALFLIRMALGMALAAIWSVSGFFFYWGLLSLFNLACLILLVYLAVMAFQRRMIVIPVLGPLARQQAGA